MENRKNLITFPGFMRLSGREVHNVASGKGILLSLHENEFMFVLLCLFENRFAEVLLEAQTILCCWKRPPLALMKVHQVDFDKAWPGVPAMLIPATAT